VASARPFPKKVAQQLKTLGAALFGMKLHSVKRSILDKGKPGAIVGVISSRGVSKRRGCHGVGIGEVKETSLQGDACQQCWFAVRCRQAVPTEMGNFVEIGVSGLDAHGVKWQQAKAGLTRSFLAGTGEQLETQTDPQAWQPCLEEPDEFGTKA
jgi:hypothetical protein